MSTSKGKERAFNPTGSIIIIAIISPVQAKDIYSKVKVSDTFIGDRKKFKIYEAQCCIYLWADAKKENWRNLKIILK
jgi:hypothetical protein